MEYHYHGKPCKRCGGTLRYTRNRGCVECLKTAKQRRRTETPKVIEKYHGKPCRVCGETLRYVSGRACVNCRKVKNQKLTLKIKSIYEQLPKRKPGSDRCLSCGETKNYFFLGYCRECVAKEKARIPEQTRGFTRCDWCGEYKRGIVDAICRKCRAAEQRRRLYWEAEDKLRELEKRQRRYEDPF